MDATVFENVTSIQGMAYFTNDSTGGVLFSGGIAVFFVVLLMVLLKRDMPFIDAFTVSSWSIFVLSAFLWFADLLPTLLVLVFLFLAALGALLMYATNPLR